MQHGKVTLDVNDGIGVLTLNDPASLNAWGEKMKADFACAIDQIEAPANGIRCVVLTGAGRAFSSGANLNDPDAPPRDRAAEAASPERAALTSTSIPCSYACASCRSRWWRPSTALRQA